MILTLDIGNSQIHGGLFIPPSGTFSGKEELKLQFRKTTKQGNTSDELGLFLRSVIRENGFDPDGIKEIALCSVVPEIVHSVRNACKKYFDVQPFVLQAGTRTGLKIKYRNPLEVGSDRIANAIAAAHLFPEKNLIIVDFGTATTYCAITAQKEYLGGLILPGLRISMEALESKTAKLPSVEILAPEEIVGRSTVESIQSGLYFGNIHAMKGIAAQIKSRYFGDRGCVVIGTGGFARLFEKEQVYDALVPELVLAGLKLALEMNRES